MKSTTSVPQMNLQRFSAHPLETEKATVSGLVPLLHLIIKEKQQLHYHPVFKWSSIEIYTKFEESVCVLSHCHHWTHRLHIRPESILPACYNEAGFSKPDFRVLHLTHRPP